MSGLLEMLSSLASRKDSQGLPLHRPSFSVLCKLSIVTCEKGHGGPGPGQPRRWDSESSSCHTALAHPGLGAAAPTRRTALIAGTDVHARASEHSRLTLWPFSALASRFPAWFPILS